MIKLKSLLFEDITETPNFKRWFGNSKVVDKHGNPLVVYHGSNSKFTSFNKEKIGSSTQTLIRGFFFTDSKNIAQKFGDNVLAVYLSIKNPMIIDAEGRNVRSVLGSYEEGNARESGNDGFIVKNVVDALGFVVNIGSWSSSKVSTLYITFDSSQIKSATDNNGEFSTTNPDITKESI